MKNPFKRIGSALSSAAAAIGSAASKVFSIFKQKAPEPSVPKSRKQLREDAESRATRQALWAIENAVKNPTDKTAQEGRKKAVEYLSRAEQLKKHGKLQDWNRQQMAERWLRSDLSSAEGQQGRKDKKLEIFNSNFNLDMNEEQAEMLADLMDTDSYKQLAETYQGIYGDIVQAMGEAIENGTDPERVERTLNLFLSSGVQPEFDTFSKVIDLSTEDFFSLEQDLTFYAEEQGPLPDEFEAEQDKLSIIGRYVDWS